MKKKEEEIEGTQESVYAGRGLLTVNGHAPIEAGKDPLFAGWIDGQWTAVNRPRAGDPCERCGQRWFRQKDGTLKCKSCGSTFDPKQFQK